MVTLFVVFCYAFCIFLVQSDITDDLWLERIPNVLSPERCQQIIDVSEKVGFPADGRETIDAGLPGEYESFSIDVYNRRKSFEHERLWPLLEPIMSQINDLVYAYKLKQWKDHPLKEMTKFKSTTLDWIFLRRYSPKTPRYSLKVHADVNTFTVTVPLNGMDDYEGGGFFVLQPSDQWTYYPDDEWFRPVPPLSMKSYEYLQNVRRRNTSEHIFPDLNAGDLFIYNYSVYHGVAPVERGNRYSLLIFYDMQYFRRFMHLLEGRPPVTPIEVQSAADIGDEIEMDVLFVNLMEDAWTIDFFHVRLDEDGQLLYALIEDGMHYNDEVSIHTYSGHLFRAVRRQTNQIVAQFVMELEVERYEMKLGVGIGSQ